jgi:hypothetical protein
MDSDFAGRHDALWPVVLWPTDARIQGLVLFFPNIAKACGKKSHRALLVTARECVVVRWTARGWALPRGVGLPR